MRRKWKRPPRVALLPLSTSANVSWVVTDARLLEALGCRVTRYGWRGHWRGVPDQLRIAQLAATHDLLFCWFAYKQACQAVQAARWFRKPVACVAGGFETAGAGVYEPVPQPWARQRKWMLERLDAILAMSEFSGSEIRILTDNEVEVLCLAADGDRFRPAGEKEPVALTVASSIDRVTLERKGIEAFLQAATHAPGIEFQVVGRVHPEVEATVRQSARGRAKLLGWLPGEELLARLQKAAVYVQASRHEGFGMAVAEAMLCECVPVVTQVAALPEVVGDTGVLVRDQDPEGLAEAVRQACRLPQKGREARQRVLERFSLQRRQDGLDRVLSRLLPHLRAETP